MDVAGFLAETGRMAQVAAVSLRIHRRYLGPGSGTWPAFFRDRAESDAWLLWSVSPDTGVASVNPGFRPEETRWHARAGAPGL